MINRFFDASIGFSGWEEPVDVYSITESQDANYYIVRNKVKTLSTTAFITQPTEEEMNKIEQGLRSNGEWVKIRFKVKDITLNNDVLVKINDTVYIANRQEEYKILTRSNWSNYQMLVFMAQREIIA
jgi:hypothetical protein